MRNGQSEGQCRELTIAGSQMTEHRYIWCRNCNEIHHVTPFDRAPGYRMNLGEETELPMDDRGAFMRRHSGHRLEGLQGVGERYFPDGQALDPMRVGYVEVTNGKESFVVRSFRNRIEDPLHFELLRGRLKAVGTTASIQENEIRKEMKHHYPWRPSERPDDEKIELFVRLFNEVVRGMDPRQIELCGYDDTASSVAYGVLSSAIVEKLMQECRNHFDQETLSGLRRFIDAHRDQDGVMTLRIVRRYAIEESGE